MSALKRPACTFTHNQSNDLNWKVELLNKPGLRFGGEETKFNKMYLKGASFINGHHVRPPLWLRIQINSKTIGVDHSYCLGGKTQVRP